MHLRLFDKFASLVKRSRGALLAPLRSADGVEAVELAIAIPLVVVLMFGAFDIARMVAGYSAVRAGTYQGTRWAIGIDRPVWDIPISSGKVNVADLGSSDYFTWAGGSPGWYLGRPAGDPVTELYPMEAQAMAYAIQIIRRTIGYVKYPCEDEPSCIACFTMRKDPEYRNFFAEPSGSNSFSSRILGINCSFNVPISSTLFALGYLPRYIQVSRSAYVTVDNYAKAEFDPADPN